MSWFRLKSIGLVCGILMVPAATAYSQVPRYQIIDLGTLGGPESIAWGLNEHGEVVGVSDTSEGNSYGPIDHGFLWLPVAAYGLPAGLNDLGTLGGARSDAFSINDAGQITGGAQTTSGSPFGWHPYVWQNGVLHDIGVRYTAFLAGGFGINASGQVVSTEPTGYEQRATLWLPAPAYGREAGLYTAPELGVVSEPSVAFHDINTHGAVVGQIGGIDVAETERAMLWLPAPMYGLPAGVTEITPPPYTSGTAIAINDSGQAVGWAWVDHYETAFVWESGNASILEDLIGVRSSGMDINESGDIVGWANVDFSFPYNHGFLLREGAYYDLNDLVPPGSGYVIASANAINEAGQIAATATLGKDYGFRAVLLQPLCLTPRAPRSENLTLPKNRYISFQLAPDPTPSALRVRLLDTPQFPSFNGTDRWVGPPAAFPNDNGSSSTFMAAALQCEPYFGDWSQVGTLHVLGAEIVPGSTYEIVTAQQACSGAPGELMFSPALTVTTAKWGDVAELIGGDTQPDFLDISALVDAFKGLPNAPGKPRAQLQPNIPNPSSSISFLDISTGVDAFRGSTYPFGGPQACLP